MITTWRKCADCKETFGLTSRSTHAGLKAKRIRCGICRHFRDLAQRAAAEKGRRERLKAPLLVRGAETAPIESGSLSERHRANQGCSEAVQIGAAGTFSGTDESPG